MIAPDFAGAWQYALQRPERELSPLLVYHSVAHTRDDVVLAVERLATLEGVEGEERNLLLTAAWYHDIGFVETDAANHEVTGARIAAEVLPRYGLTPPQVRVVGDLILATRIQHSPATLLEEILADADLDLLGRDDFWTLNQALRIELAALGKPTTGKEWYAGQLAFLQTHHYYTAAAHSLRTASKQQHIQEMAAMLEQCRRE